MKKIITLTIFLIILLSTGVSALDETQIEKVSSVLSSAIADSFPPHEGQVLSTRGESGVFINLGEKNGIAVGDQFEVFSLDAVQKGNSPGTSSVESSGRINSSDRINPSERIAVIKVESVKVDYAFSEIIARSGDTQIDQNDFVRYIQPERKLFISKLDGPYALEVLQQLSIDLRRVSYFQLAESEYSADYIISGELIQKPHGLDAKLVIKGKTGDLPAIQKRFILREMESMQKKVGAGYIAYPLEEVMLDFIAENDKEFVMLGQKNIFTAQMTSDGPKVITKEQLSDIGKPQTREPIGRIQFFDLDLDSNKELLIGISPSDSSRYYVPEDGGFVLSGPLPGIPMSNFNNSSLLIGKLTNGYNLFDPQATSIINVSSSGFGNQTEILNINRPYLDIAMIDTNSDSKAEILVLYPDGSLVWFDPFNPNVPVSPPQSGVGLGLYVHDDNSIFTSSSGSSQDRLQKYKFSENTFIKVSESQPLPYHIYRIGTLCGKISALALDDSDRCMLIVFDNLLP
jgi:hypothetical protein